MFKFIHSCLLQLFTPLLYLIQIIIRVKYFVVILVHFIWSNFPPWYHFCITLNIHFWIVTTFIWASRIWLSFMVDHNSLNNPCHKPYANPQKQNPDRNIDILFSIITVFIDTRSSSSESIMLLFSELFLLFLSYICIVFPVSSFFVFCI